MRERNEYEDEIDLTRVFEIIRKDLLLFLLICFLCCAAAFAITKYVLKSEYTATAKIIIVQKSDAAGSQQSYTYSDQQLSQKLANTYAQIIMSEAISDPVVSNLSLTDKYGIDSAAYRKIVSVSAVNGTEVMNITAKTNDPELSASLANEIVKVFESKIYDIMQIENVVTLSYAKVPKGKSGPNLSRNLMTAMMCGLFLCALITVITLFTDTKVKTEDEVKAIFDYPVIGNIPDFEFIDSKEDEDDDA